MDVFVPITANASPLHGMVNIAIIGIFKKLNCYEFFNIKLWIAWIMALYAIGEDQIMCMPSMRISSYNASLIWAKVSYQSSTASHAWGGCEPCKTKKTMHLGLQ